MSAIDLALSRLSAAFDLPGAGGRARVVVAMSGGVDSSVAAALTARAGYEAIGITLQLYDQGAALKRKGACCAGQDIYDAAQAAERIGIAHYVLDYETRFRAAVIDDFADAYLRGETPIPCVRCNQTVKFADLMQAARDLGAQALVTGHYVQRIQARERAELHRAADHSRDQSYFLYATTQAQVDFLRFPLGGMPKSQTRALAAELGLGVADKPDSQDICFVPDGDYASIVKALRPEAERPGDIVHQDGRVLGQHAGIIHFTVGQRRGITGGQEEPLYVLSVEPESARVIVGPRAALAIRTIPVHDLNWLGDIPLTDAGLPVLVKVRSARPPVAAELRAAGATGCAEVTLLAPEFGIAPGQAAVFYEPAQGSRVLGGGTIGRAARAHGAPHA